MALAGDVVTDRSFHSAEFSDEIAGVSPNRRFACPGLFRIVPSRDGGICRIKLARGLVTSAQLRTIAEAAAHYGTPAIEVTNRSNIQIRGVKNGVEEALIDALVAAGLGTRSSGADDVRNVMVSPMAGLDPTALIDVSQLADAILARLEAQPAYHALSPKFSIQIDGGESVAMIEHPNDIWFSAADAAHFALGFAGVPGERPAGVVAAADVEAALFALLDLFIAEIGKTNATGDKITRMRHLLVERRTEEFASALPCPVSPMTAWQREEPMPLGHIGARQQSNDSFAMGAVPPLGRLDTAMLRGLADLADLVSAGEIRMTPWQSVLLPNIAEDALADAVAQLDELGFITRPDRTLAATITCAGSAGCKSGLADTKADALALAEEIDGTCVSVFGLHLTGCSKSCASPRPAPVTLLGISPGHYDVFVRNADSLRNDEKTAGFGKRIGADLTIEQAGRLLADKHSRVPE